MSSLLDYYHLEKKSLRNQRPKPTPSKLAVKIALWTLVWAGVGLLLVRAWLLAGWARKMGVLW